VTAASHSADLLLRVSRLATPEGRDPLAGTDLGQVREATDAGLAIVDGRIEAVGSWDEVSGAFTSENVERIDAGLLVPGFVDAHTHPIFGGTREAEFEMRTRGADYGEIARAGGGILASVASVRGASNEELLAGLLMRLDRFLALGTTTVEAKTGYGLSTEDELRCLEVLAQANAEHPVDLVPTFLGAHEVPAEYRSKPGAYVDLLVEEMIPRVAEAGTAAYCDVFTESHVFGIEDSRRILTRARDLGLGLRLHADQLTPLGGAELAAELGAATADHLECVTARGIEALAGASVQPVLCPLVPLVLRQEQEAPARRMIDAGLAPVLATDFNPGSCFNQNMGDVLTWAALRYSMTAEECLAAATLNAACSVGRGDSCGSIEVGKRADLVVLDVPDLAFLCYEFGRAAVRMVIKDGSIVYRWRGE